MKKKVTTKFSTKKRSLKNRGFFSKIIDSCYNFFRNLN